MFICEVVLPEKSPLQKKEGKPAARKSLAKRSAAFEACLALRRMGLLDTNLLSTYHKRMPVMRNALLAITSKKTNQYDRRVKPDFWQSSWGVIPDSLYVTLVRLVPSAKLSRTHAPLAILTKKPLPKIPIFPLYLEEDVKSDVVCKQLTTPLRVTSSSLRLLTSFTLRVFHDLFNKKYESKTENVEMEKMSYWLAPVQSQWELDDCLDPDRVIDWNTLQFVQNNEQIPWTIDKPVNFLDERFLFDQFDGKWRYFSLGVVPTLKASDPVPEGMPHRRNKANIMDYSSSLYKKARAYFLANCHWDGPVILTDVVRLRRNLLDKMTEKEKKVATKCYVCPEALVISAVSLVASKELCKNMLVDSLT